MDIKKKIHEVRSALTWSVSQIPGASDLEITSNPWLRAHTITLPTSGVDWRDIEYLHELAHATLAERHHLLSTAYFAGGISQEDISPLINPIRCASDWFADDLLMQWCPEAETQEIREHADYAKMLPEPPDAEMMYMGGLMLAQAVAYLDDNKQSVPKHYRKVVTTLLDDFPPVPAVRAKERLINRLASLTVPQRVSVVVEDGMDVWSIRKEKKT